MAEGHDAVVVGSGVNGLACAALLAKAGWDVCVLERNDWFGGAIRTAELTEPGFRHDVFSAWHPLWVGGPVHPQLEADLARHGLEYVNTDLPTATAFPDGSSSFLLKANRANDIVEAVRECACGKHPCIFDGNWRNKKKKDCDRRSGRIRPGDASDCSGLKRRV